MISAPIRFRNRSVSQFASGICIGRFPKLSHNQHPAGSHSKSRAGLFASSKKHAGRNKTRQTNRRTDEQTDGQTSFWSSFWSTLAQIPFAFPKISGSEAKLLWYLHRPGSGTGPNAYIPLVSASTGFQNFRIISTPLGRTPKVVLGCSQAQKNKRGAIIMKVSKITNEGSDNTENMSVLRSHSTT